MPKPNTLGKNLHLCFSAMKRPQTHPSSTASPPQILPNYHHSPPPTTTLIKNYNSLYEEDCPTAAAYYSAPTSPSTAPSEDTDEAAVLAPATPDLSAIYASQRFFISSPGRSNSIVDSLSLSSTSSSSSSSSPSPSSEVAGGVPVQTYSPNPYVDFRRSMQEMVEARDHHHQPEGKEASWDYLQELLLSYLSLNPKNTHKYIVGAFADLVASLLLSPNHFINNNKS